MHTKSLKTILRSELNASRSDYSFSPVSTDFGPLPWHRIFYVIVDAAKASTKIANHSIRVAATNHPDGSGVPGDGLEYLIVTIETVKSTSTIPHDYRESTRRKRLRGGSEETSCFAIRAITERDSVKNLLLRSTVSAKDIRAWPIGETLEECSGSRANDPCSQTELSCQTQANPPPRYLFAETEN
jgi:hypothetical protein